nr:hypothetical protein [uncultured Desulfobulbus sp.]
MLPINPLRQLLTHIQKLIPANGVILVGAGSGTGQWITWLQKMKIQSTLLIEADSKNYIQLEAFTQHVPGWLIENSIIAETQKNATFHIVANRSESSLLPPSLLQKLWPNINSIENHSCQTVTLDNICKKNNFVANWLIIDCLPSLAILRGSIKCIDGFDVIVVRMVLNQKVPPSEDAGQNEIDSFLQDNGYRCVEKEHERHPDLAHGLYIRDYKLLAGKRREQIQQLSAQKKDQKKLADDRLDQIENLNNRLKQQLEEHQRQIEQLNSQKDTHKKLAQDRLDQTENLKNRLKQQLEEHQRQIEQLNSQKDTHEKLAQDRLDQIENLKNRLKQQLEEHQRQIEQLNSQKDTHEKLAQDRLDQIENLKNRLKQQLEEHQRQIEQLNSQKDTHEKLAQDRLDQTENLKNRLKQQLEKHQRQIEQLNSQKDTHEKLAQDRLDQTENLKNRLKQQLEEHQRQIEQLNSQKDTHEKLAQDRLTEIKTLRNKLISPEQREQERIRLEARVVSCCSAQDPHSAIDNELEKGNLAESEKIHFLLMVSDAFYSRGDKMTALHYLRMPLEWGSSLSMLQKNMLVSALIRQGRAELAADIVIQDMLTTSKVDGLKPEEQMAIRKAYSEKTRLIHSQKEHGHDLLLSYLESNLGKFREEHGQGMPVFIEIGTTRENVPGQGSTRKISMFCKQNELTFITVDMDPHNTLMAQRMFSRLGVNAKAITAKGEDFLRDYEGVIDFVFLDAYDFDHGGHSSLRQSRYEQFLGKRIDDKDCHKMHLDCVKSIIPKLSKNGIICLDDTWTENSIWMAKGTLAVPYLLEQGFIILEARNRAALLIKPEQ